MAKKIVDTHVHIWDFSKAEYKWLEGDKTILNRTYSITELTPQIAKANVTNGVLVQAANNIEDTLWDLEVAKATDWINGVVGWLPLKSPKEVEDLLSDGYASAPLFKGCRHLIHNEADPKWLLQDVVLDSLRLLAARQIPYDVVGVNSEHLKTAIKVGELIPELKMVFDHLNQPPIAAKNRFGEWGSLIKEAAQNPNMYAKISGLGSTVDNGKNWTKDDIKPYIMYAIEQFGTKRCFGGGDWPIALLAGEYETAWLIYQGVLSEELGAEDEGAILSKNAIDFYHL